MKTRSMANPNHTIETKGALTLTYDNGKLVKAQSYDVTIFSINNDGTYDFDATKYSVTTSKHQTMVKRIVGI